MKNEGQGGEYGSSPPLSLCSDCRAIKKGPKIASGLLPGGSTQPQRDERPEVCTHLVLIVVGI